MKNLFKQFTIKEHQQPIIFKISNQTINNEIITLFGYNLNKNENGDGLSPHIQIFSHKNNCWEQYNNKSQFPIFKISTVKLAYKNFDQYRTIQFTLFRKGINNINESKNIVPVNCRSIYQYSSTDIDVSHFDGWQIDDNAYFKTEILAQTELSISIFPYTERQVGFFEYRKYLKDSAKKGITVHVPIPKYTLKYICKYIINFFTK